MLTDYFSAATTCVTTLRVGDYSVALHDQNPLSIRLERKSLMAWLAGDHEAAPHDCAKVVRVLCDRNAAPPASFAIPSRQCRGSLMKRWRAVGEYCARPWLTPKKERCWNPRRPSHHVLTRSSPTQSAGKVSSLVDRLRLGRSLTISKQRRPTGCTKANGRPDENVPRHFASLLIADCGIWEVLAKRPRSYSERQSRGNHAPHLPQSASLRKTRKHLNGHIQPTSEVPCVSAQARSALH